MKSLPGTCVPWGRLEVPAHEYTTATRGQTGYRFREALGENKLRMIPKLYTKLRTGAQEATGYA